MRAVLFVVAVQMLATGCAQNHVRWNGGVLRKQILAAGERPVIVLRGDQPTKQLRRLADELVLEMQDAGLSVIRGGRGGGYSASGTGFFVSKLGHIVTSAHVVGAYDQVFVEIGGKDYRAKVVAFDETNDLALLQLNGATPPDGQPPCT